MGSLFFAIYANLEKFGFFDKKTTANQRLTTSDATTLILGRVLALLGVEFVTAGPLAPPDHYEMVMSFGSIK